jgi:hypothetical protein
MDSKIDQQVIDELIAMLEDHVAGGLKPKEEAIPGVDDEAAEGDPAIGGPEHEASEMPAEEDDEDMQKLMEMYSRG